MTLLEVEDEVTTIRNYVECAYMACAHLNAKTANPLQTILSTASERLAALGKEIETLRSECS